MRNDEYAETGLHRLVPRNGMRETMKTPEQIAQSIADDWTRLDGEHKEDVIEAMIEAIEADRAQRKVVNWDEAGQLVQAYHEAADSWSGIDRSVAAMEIVNWVEYALEGGAR